MTGCSTGTDDKTPTLRNSSPRPHIRSIFHRRPISASATKAAELEMRVPFPPTTLQQVFLPTCALQSSISNLLTSLARPLSCSLFSLLDSHAASTPLAARLVPLGFLHRTLVLYLCRLSGPPAACVPTRWAYPLRRPSRSEKLAPASRCSSPLQRTFYTTAAKHDIPTTPTRHG